jgi:predicted nucleic acid-binding protein
MNGNKYLLDTNTVLYVLNGDETLAGFLYQKELYISIITEMELFSYKSITIKEEQAIANFLDEFVIINLDNKIKLNAINVKRSSNMKLPDSIIAGTSIALKLPLVASDKQFKTIGDLDLVYYER